MILDQNVRSRTAEVHLRIKHTWMWAFMVIKTVLRGRYYLQWVNECILWRLLVKTIIISLLGQISSLCRLACFRSFHNRSTRAACLRINLKYSIIKRMLTLHKAVKSDTFIDLIFFTGSHSNTLGYLRFLSISVWSFSDRLLAFRAWCGQNILSIAAIFRNINVLHNFGVHQSFINKNSSVFKGCTFLKFNGHFEFILSVFDSLISGSHTRFFLVIAVILSISIRFWCIYSSLSLFEDCNKRL